MHLRVVGWPLIHESSYIFQASSQHIEMILVFIGSLIYSIQYSVLDIQG